MIEETKNQTAVSNEQAMAEKLAEVISVVLPKMLKREIEKRFEDGEPQQKNKMININSSKK